MDPIEEASRLMALMQRVGYAVWQLQELEETSRVYVLIRLRETRGIGEERARQIEQRIERRTFGRLLRELAGAGVLPPDLAGELGEMLEERNWLVHRARRDSRGILSQPELYAVISQRLDEAAERALQLLRRLAAEVERFVLKSGVNPAALQAEADRRAREWGLLD